MCVLAKVPAGCVKLRLRSGNLQSTPEVFAFHAWLVQHCLCLRHDRVSGCCFRV